MSLTLLAGPAAEPVPLDRLKSRLRISVDDYDSRLNHLIRAARERVERDTGLACLSQTWLERLDSWQEGGRLTAFATRFRLFKPPLRSVESVTTYDADDRPHLWDSSAYRVDNASHPGRIIARPGTQFPLPGRTAGGIEIRFRCGYGDTPGDVPAPITEAIELLAARLFERADGMPDGAAEPLPDMAACLIAPWRRLSL